MPLLTRSGRIILLLGLNIVVFLAEIIVGYKTGSLALIADAFHMLSDVLSQIIALYAIRLAAKTEWQPTLSYGWQRAELLGALYNGVFLLALCFSIILDAIERFFKPEDIEDPKLVLIVGGIGLACNLFGLVLFHDHSGHGHSHSHGHSHAKKAKANEKQTTDDVPVPPSAALSNREGADPERQSIDRRPSLRYQSSLEMISPLKEVNLQNLQQAVLDVQKQLEDDERFEREDAVSSDRHRPNAVVVSMDAEDHDNHNHAHEKAHHNDHAGHDHHSHGTEGKKGKMPSGEDLNMRGIFVHVLGDALGSVGVIFTALIIWLTNFSWRFYFDPIISLLITAIIIHSAVPLVRSASFILLQGVPVGVEIEEIRKEIKAIPGVISIHDLHIWQLTNIKMVASLHVLVANQEAFTTVSRAVKTIMHRAGVHSTTIQPEFPSMNPHLFQIANAKNGLRLRNASLDDDANGLLSVSDLSSRATSLGAQSEEFLPSGSMARPSSPGHGTVGASTSAAGSNASVLILTPEEQTAVDESNCALLCIDGEQACDVGRCCTAPVKR
ncbi:cation efflux family-domain-containing protein [Gamsiella multidivaricata]|uniref:cation efflux family-domain-containing protein n=1 Tax=Gamsiella multidivaricata TaxID=101098 RepID=UPI00221F8C84|nr:cation efflux family-domain-containing protein [Gamsiella multidivaricata]KAG0362198.1 hypothetical protein BGZ54_008719 [Gamsiella multidivaricata]KAI7816088.1 cation efflux family-domain-containing protein [Gamsiella multidivaricata]